MNRAHAPVPVTAPLSTPRERLTFLRGEIHGFLLKRASGQVTSAEMDAFAITYRKAHETARDTDAEYSGEKLRGAYLVNREGLPLVQVETPELVAHAVLQDVLRRADCRTAHQEAARLAAAFLADHPELALPAWSVGEYRTREWLDAHP